MTVKEALAVLASADDLLTYDEFRAITGAVRGTGPRRENLWFLADGEIISGVAENAKGKPCLQCWGAWRPR
jgi:hypothetical protein